MSYEHDGHPEYLGKHLGKIIDTSCDLLAAAEMENLETTEKIALGHALATLALAVEGAIQYYRTLEDDTK